MISETAFQLADTSQTICAISTPPGRGGIAVIRVSGKEALAIADKIWRGKSLLDVPSHSAHLGHIINPDNPQDKLDEGVATVFIAPHSYTGQDTVEFSVHGSPFIQQEVIRLLIESGARLAQPGEFTRRAYTSGHLDLAQAEAVADIIDSDSRAALRVAARHMQGDLSARLEKIRQSLVELASLIELELDFSEEDVEFASRSKLHDLVSETLLTIRRLAETFHSGHAIKEGIPVVIIGAPNAGKSSLLNLLLNYERAIVTPISGTTRDLIEDSMIIGDYKLRLIDTAGLRETDDPIESIGIFLTNKAIEKASIVIYVHDSTTPLPSPISPDSPINHLPESASVITVLNKSDLPSNPNLKEALASWPYHIVNVSALSTEGLDDLRKALVDIIEHDIINPNDDILITNRRHADSLQATADSLQTVITGLNTGLSSDLIALDLRQAISHLSSITAPITTPDVLTHIFSHFCVGK